MLRLASKTTPSETGASSELKYLSCCSTPSSNNRNDSRGSPENDAPNGSVTVTGISVNLTFTRIAGCGEAGGREALRGVIRTRGASATALSAAAAGRMTHIDAMAKIAHQRVSDRLSIRILVKFFQSIISGARRGYGLPSGTKSANKSSHR